MLPIYTHLDFNGVTMLQVIADTGLVHGYIVVGDVHSHTQDLGQHNVQLKVYMFGCYESSLLTEMLKRIIEK